MPEVLDKLLEHQYDGIEEYDNPLPPWWVYFFVLSILWGGAYIFYYHIAEIGPGSKGEFAEEVREYETEFADAIFAAQNINWDEPNFKPIEGEAAIIQAKGIFGRSCASCHGKEGQGGIGPNLTDPYWIHGPEFNDVVRTIAMGVPEKGMISWKATLSKDDILQVASFVMTLQGTNPDKPKPPQGQKYEVN